MGRLISMELPKKRMSSYDRKIEQLIREDVGSWEYVATIEQERVLRDLEVGAGDYGGDDFDEYDRYDH